VTEAVDEKLSGSAASREKPWMKMVGGLSHLRKETARVQRVIDKEFEKIEPEDRG
jgi:hypothetical protein